MVFAVPRTIVDKPSFRCGSMHAKHFTNMKEKNIITSGGKAGEIVAEKIEDPSLNHVQGISCCQAAICCRPAGKKKDGALVCKLTRNAALVESRYHAVDCCCWSGPT